MAIQAYCQVDGVKGEATEEGHGDWIKLRSFAHSVSQRHNMGSGSALKGQGVNMGTFSLVKEVDKSSVDLNKLCAQGTKIKQVRIDVCSDVEGSKPSMVYTLANVIIAHVGVSAGESGADLIEHVDLAYDEVNWFYVAYKADGNTKDSEFGAGWQVSKKKLLPKKKV